MKQVLIRQGQAAVEEVPAPLVEPGAVLVRVDHSCISVGTELSGLRSGGQPLWRRALAQPNRVKKALRMAATQGLTRTYRAAMGGLSAGDPCGYSAAGVVLTVGEGIRDLRPGDPVACAGAQCAHHAEIICVPRNLVVSVPRGLDLAAASTVTLGAIALQGVRRANPTLGETFVVIGLGVLGQLTHQILKAGGCRVLGMDPDPGRAAMAADLGLFAALHPEGGDPIAQILRLTDGCGADGVIISAATPSDEVVATAFRACRKKGRVVLVGDVGLHLRRADLYEKELDFFISTSYGPGRYDRNYEDKGLDYPIGYVRWTENRNMDAYLRLVAGGQVRVAPLIEAVYPVDEAPAAYASLQSPARRPLMVLLAYPPRAADVVSGRAVANPAARASGAGRIRLAVVGAGDFARSTHLPNLQALADLYDLRAVVSRRGHNAVAAARQFGANYAGTDYQQVLQDPEVDAVLIATRHHLHAGMALAALRAGKHVLVEKPLALTQAELDAVTAFFASLAGAAPAPVLLTGFNRRFSPCARRIHTLVQGRTSPMILNYRMNAGYLPLDHWVHTAEGGGRNRGEACHIYDLFTYLTGSPVATVYAQAIAPATGHYAAGDNFVATMRFADGSVASLTYTALGTAEYPKEHLEVFVDGMVLVLDDYKRLRIHGARARGVDSKVVDKGQKAELGAFARAIRQGGEWPIPLWQQVQATALSLAVEEEIGG